jgi:alpha-L-arabinofuranosidase
VETGRWYDLRIECQGTRIRTFLDDAPVNDVMDQGVPDFAVAAGRSADGTILVEAVNGSNAARDYTVQLAGSPAATRKATVTVLTAASLDAENTLDAPRTVAPNVEMRDVASDRFVHTFAPRSLTVLRLTPK